MNHSSQFLLVMILDMAVVSVGMFSMMIASVPRVTIENRRLYRRARWIGRFCLTVSVVVAIVATSLGIYFGWL